MTRDESSCEDNLFDSFATALRAATPIPDGARREAAIRTGVEIFSQACQDSARPARHEGGKARFLADVQERITEMRKGLMRTLAVGGGGVVAASVLAGVWLVTGPEMRDSGLTATVDAPQDAALNAAPEPLAPALGRDRDLAMPQMPQTRGDAFAELLGGPAEGSGGAMAEPASPNRLQAESFVSAAPEVQALSAVMPDHLPVADRARDRFDGAPIHGVSLTSEQPVSTFSFDVDTASYSFVRRLIQDGRVPEPGMVRIEEMVNYFPYDYPAPAAGSDHPFATHVSVFAAPWNPARELVRIGIQGVEPPLEDRPPLDLVLLIDTSGSMQSPDKLGLLRRSFLMMLPQLQDADRVGVVTYAGASRVALEMTPAGETDAITAALLSLEAGGSTAGASGLRDAYAMLEGGDEGRIGRVILATDGDFNVGMSSVDEMKSFIEDRRESGAYLSVLGFGQGNYNDALMQALAQNGNGQAAYIDTLSEARKVLVDQLSGALFPIANDVKIQVEFNPSEVAEYRLVGYETRTLEREDFNNDRVDAGEIGAGHQVTALYEITRTGSGAGAIEPLRYGQEPVATADLGEELGYVNLRYKRPGETSSVLLGTPILGDAGAADADARFAAAIAGLGQLLKDDRYLGDWGYREAAELARGALGEDGFGHRHEAVRLIEILEAVDP